MLSDFLRNARARMAETRQEEFSQNLASDKALTHKINLLTEEMNHHQKEILASITDSQLRESLENLQIQVDEAGHNKFLEEVEKDDARFSSGSSWEDDGIFGKISDGFLPK